MNALDAALLDLDGTVIDSHDLILASFLHVCDRFGLPPDLERFRRGIGRPLEEILAGFAPDGDGAPLAAAYREHNDLHHDDVVRAFPGMVDTVAALRGAGVRVAIVTSKSRPFAERGLRLVGIEVDLLVGPKDAAHPKPAPDPVWFALERLGVARDRAVMVGDAASDLLSGRAAGVRTAAVRWSALPHAELEACAPDLWLERPEDLLRIALGPAAG